MSTCYDFRDPKEIYFEEFANSYKSLTNKAKTSILRQWSRRFPKRRVCGHEWPSAIEYRKLFKTKKMRIIIKSIVFSVLLSMFINNTLAQINLFNFEEIEIGAKKISKFYDSITYVKQKNFVQVYYIDFSIYKNCEKSYRIIACHDLMSLLSKRYNYFFSIYKRYYIFYCNDSIEHYRIKFVDEEFRKRLTQFFIYDNANYFSGDVGMGCEFNSCSENKLYLAYPPGSRYINRKKLEE